MSFSLDLTHVKSFISADEYNKVFSTAKESLKILKNKTGLGNDFLGWVDLPLNYDKEEFQRILKAADYIKNNASVLVVVGIGGSYLGAKSAIEMLKKYFNNKGVEIIFVGHQISSSYTCDLIEYLKDKDYCINVISKSGTTTEPAIAFRIFKELIEEKYGVEESKKRIFATTDKSVGALKKLSNIMGYETFVVPDDVGGRFSVLTAVGLLPIACSGVDITKLLQGANDARSRFINEDDETNEALIYATVRNVLYNSGKKIEMLINYEPALSYFSEWWKQLYGESEGKDKKGIFVASANFSTDLHSLGQMIQDGERTIFETVLNVLNPRINKVITETKDNLDGLNFLKGKTIDEVNKNAMLGTTLAHVSGGVPNLIISIDELSAYNYGYLAYFFMIACGISGYILKVNPFDQPGVEAYKKNMFALLGKPGYEELKKELESQIKK